MIEENKPIVKRISNMVLTAVVGGGLGFVGSWFTMQERIADQERRIEVLENTAGSKEQTKALLEAINTANASIDRRLSNIEAAMMRNK